MPKPVSNFVQKQRRNPSSVRKFSKSLCDRSHTRTTGVYPHGSKLEWKMVIGVTRLIHDSIAIVGMLVVLLIDTGQHHANLLPWRAASQANSPRFPLQVRATDRAGLTSGPKQSRSRAGYGKGQRYVHQSTFDPWCFHHGIESRF